MPAHDRAEHPLMQALAESFGALEDAGEIDLLAFPASAEFEVQADDWTLHLDGWPLVSAFIALDDEPGSDAERRAALNAALDPPHIAAIRDLDALLDGAVGTALSASGDALSGLLAALLAEEEG